MWAETTGNQAPPAPATGRDQMPKGGSSTAQERAAGARAGRTDVAMVPSASKTVAETGTTKVRPRTVRPLLTPPVVQDTHMPAGPALKAAPPATPTIASPVPSAGIVVMLSSMPVLVWSTRPSVCTAADQILGSSPLMKSTQSLARRNWLSYSVGSSPSK